MSRGIKDGKLQSNIDFNGYVATNSGGVAPGGSLLITNNLSELTATASTARTNIGLTTISTATSTTLGRNIVNVSTPGANSWIRCASDGTAALRTASQTLSDIGAQTSNGNLSILSLVNPGSAGLKVLESAIPIVTGYVQVASTSGAVAFKTRAQLAVDVLNGMTLTACTGTLQVDGLAKFNDFNAQGAEVIMTGNVNIAAPAGFAISGTHVIILTATATTNVTLPNTGTLATLAGTEVFANKTINAPAIVGGTHTAITSFGVRATGSGTGPFDLKLTNNEVLSGDRTLTIRTGNSSRTLQLGGHLFTAGTITQLGAFNITLNVTGATNITLPETGTLATLTGAETLTNKIVPKLTFEGGAWLEGDVSDTLNIIADDVNFGNVDLLETSPAADVWIHANRLQVGFSSYFSVSHGLSAPANTILYLARPGGGVANMVAEAWGGANTFLLGRRNGAVGASTGVVSGNSLGQFSFAGSTGSADPTQVAVITAQATENFALGATGTSMSMRTVTNGTDVIADRLVIDLKGAVNVKNGLITATDAISGANAVGVVTVTTKVTTTGAAQALTLADGTDGQIKIIIHDVDGGSAVLTPTTKTGYTTITFTNAGETAMLQYVSTRGWMIVSLRGAVAA